MLPQVISVVAGTVIRECDQFAELSAGYVAENHGNLVLLAHNMLIFSAMIVGLIYDTIVSFGFGVVVVVASVGLYAALNEQRGENSCSYC